MAKWNLHVFQVTYCGNDNLHKYKAFSCFSCLPQCIDQLAVVQAELQESVKELTKSRKKYQEAETMAQAVREKAELDAKYEPDCSTAFHIIVVLLTG